MSEAHLVCTVLLQVLMALVVLTYLRHLRLAVDSRDLSLLLFSALVFCGETQIATSRYSMTAAQHVHT